MINFVSIIVICAIFALSVLVALHALFRSRNHKKYYFLLMQTMIILSLFGYFQELTSTSADEAFSAVMLLYFGSFYAALLAFFFVADYYNVNLHPVFVKAPMVILTTAAILSMWTTKYHHLVYQDFGYSMEYVHQLTFTPGPLYFVLKFYTSFCMLLAMAILLYQLKKWSSRYRKQILLFLFCLIIPFLAEAGYSISVYTGINPYKIHFSQHSIAIMSICLYFGFIRYNVFEIISAATLTAMEHIKEGVVIVDDNDNYLSSNPAASEMFPAIEKLENGVPVSSYSNWPDELKTAGMNSVEFCITNGESKYYEASISPVLTKKQTLKAKIILLKDVTDSVHIKRELENSAYTDALTSLYNRKHFAELAARNIERAQRINESIYTAMLDLDFFKKINDTYMHAAGDLVLKTVAEIVKQTIRSYDLSGRYGGEEFVILITGLVPMEAYKLMERIRENIEQSIIWYEGIGLKVTCSIGINKFNETDTFETSLVKADEALYTSKKTGRNRVTFYGGLT